MADWTLLEHDPLTGRRVYVCVDGELTHVRTDYPADEIVDMNAHRRAASVGQSWGDGRIEASIPLNIYHDELEAAVVGGDDRYIARWLDDGDHCAFRTFHGRTG